jgi:hypothetical protein
VLEIARENGWGYTRILGQLRQLGIDSISAACSRTRDPDDPMSGVRTEHRQRLGGVLNWYERRAA